jgi:hypothetical protein
MSKMTKWDTIQADVSDMYVGREENEKWESERISTSDLFDEDDMAYLDGDLTLDWED